MQNIGYLILDRKDFSMEQYTALETLCPSQRRAKAERYRREEDRQLCVLGGAALTLCLSEALNCPPTMLHFSEGKHGKPYLEGNPCYFNLSHSKDKVLFAVSPYPIGCDIEAFHTPGEALLRGAYSAEERCYVGTPPDPQRFTEIWCCKEALVKESGEGLNRKLQELSCCDENGLLSDIREIPLLRGVLENYAFALAGKDVKKAVCLFQSAVEFQRKYNI